MVRMRRLAAWAGALVLGLPVALLAHLATFGDAHIVGGTDHTVVVAGAWALAAVAALASAAAAVLSSRRTQSGSVAAARLRAYLPSWGALAVSAGLWYLAVERLESSHIAISLTTVLALAALAYLAVRVTRSLLRAFASLAIAWFAPGRAPLAIPSFRFVYASPALAMAAPVRRRFARPPPHLP